MAFLIGVDEAGYGPNLGPLVVAATVWEVEATEATEATTLDLYNVLDDVVTRGSSFEKLAIADSKQLYNPGKGLRQLERGVLAPQAQEISNWSQLLEVLQADRENRRGSLPWHNGFDCSLPLDASADEVSNLGLRFKECCHANRVQLCTARASLVFPDEFNQLVEKYDTKGAALSHVTLALVRELIDEYTNGPTLVVCDKHGGRNRYGALLQHHFSEHSPTALIEVLMEGRAESRYRWESSESQVEIVFRTKGESFLPTALASMNAKYLRELAMKALNQFWCERVPHLKPTAGYPVDAKRYKAQIAAKQKSLGVPDQILWRCR